MDTIKLVFANFWLDQRGATAIEYALIAALVSVAVIAGASLLGVNIGGLFQRIAGCMTNPVAGCMSA